MSTRPSIPTGRRIALAGALLVLVLGSAWGWGRLPGCARDRSGGGYASAPTFLFLREFSAGGRPLAPRTLQVQGDTLFVAYDGLGHIEALDFDLEPRFRIDLQAPEPVVPAAFVVTDSTIVVADRERGIVAIFDRAGQYQTSFGTLPDGATPLAPAAMTAYMGTAYVADRDQGRVLAVSLNDVEDLTERGELILSIPPLQDLPVGFPSGVLVTPDGRLLVGASAAGRVLVFTCDGRPVYEFDPVPGSDPMQPRGMTYDTVRDPSLQVEDSWDPSGLPRQGRYHVADGANGVIHMFNPVGRYLGSYPEAGELESPAGLAADRAGGRIFVADPDRARILVYRFKGE